MPAVRRPTMAAPAFAGWQRSQGGAEFPTGGIRSHLREPASAWHIQSDVRVSRSGEMPEPTVIVRMKEIAQHLLGLPQATGAAAWAGAIAHALIHWLDLFESKP